MKAIASDRRVPALLSNAYDSHIGAHLVQNKVVHQISSGFPFPRKTEAYRSQDARTTCLRPSTSSSMIIDRHRTAERPGRYPR
ncbi:hypothetical protein F9K88_18980 [Brucella intermedia]|uniref:Uncharacterized protein n=4 Tax=Brucella TaxID=234 RepID=U4VCF6_9HYPH|nr:Hypothetical protein OINT_4000019 [Brucella intermedia LMG 3301]ELT48584.1 hypothetical protein D584_13565 [Brucella intermedia M86]ERI15477.1 hypothetical protein O206_18530 [Ochrobactrum sp. EGD-AQ16]ERM00417.1 hypothetical protein Q644_05225 [Brucella intermedia 229E]KAB2693057.1 hypothetical protein F9K72_18555 [Brucella intermedia]NKC28898.1 hypothetical protein [Brucella ciceri]